MVVTDFPTAELVKVSANAFLATKISFINAVAEVCDVAGADVVALADALGHDARIGRKFLNAGIGFGGGCLPKDLRAFVHRAGELGLENTVGLLREVDNINQFQRQRVVQIASAMVADLPSARVTVLGAAFKPNSDDVRDSPALSRRRSAAPRRSRRTRPRSEGDGQRATQVPHPDLRGRRP